MSESRVFMLNGVSTQTVVNRLKNFFRGEKGMEIQSSQTADGYVMQASQPKNADRNALSCHGTDGCYRRTDECNSWRRSMVR